MITISAFRRVPDFAKGLVRDLRVRWALEEAGIPYRVETVDMESKNAPAYRACQPFGQVPILRDGELVLFESGSIALYVAERSEVLLPHDAAGRARAITWTFAALNTIEPPIMQLAVVDLFQADQPWAPLRRPSVLADIRKRLGDLAATLGERAYLDGRFTVGDLMMVSVLRIPRHTGLVAEYPVLAAYQARCEARPAFQRALAAQLAGFQ